MFSIDNAEKAIRSLKINMPETYWNDAETFYIYNDPEKNFQLTLIKDKKDPKLNSLFKTLEDVEKRQYKRNLGKTEPLYCMRVRETEYENVPRCMRMEKAEENLAKDLGEILIQRYIRSRGKNRDLNS